MVDLVFEMLGGVTEGALNFCFETDMIDNMIFSDAFWERFVAYWKHLYAKSGISEKISIFNNIEERMIKNT